jgi:hypothetical protein
MWTLTYSVDGTKHVQVIPTAIVPSLRPLLERGKQYRQGIAELLAINAQLVKLWRGQQRRRKR